MTSDRRDDRSVQEAANAAQDEAGRMQDRIDELGDDIDAAAKQARQGREDADPHGDEPLGAVSGDAEERSTSSDDPASAVGSPADADER